MQIGPATLIHGDCVEAMRTLPDCSVDVVLTDPPFSSGATREAGKTGFNKTMTRGTKAEGRDRWFGSDSLSTSGISFLLRACALEWQRVLVPGGHCLVFTDWRMAAHFGDAMRLGDAIESADLRRAGLLVWDKEVFGLGRCFRNQHELILHFTKGVGREPLRRDVGNVIACKPVRKGATHPTEKPVALLETLLSVVCPEGGTVLDPFFGSASSGAAAVGTGRRWIGVER
ncbi:MAG TPA: DNA methyltransferase, partial [Azospirillum sp.]|nr:DNA methyltransferase [Azospirillum sp.]